MFLLIERRISHRSSTVSGAFIILVFADIALFNVPETTLTVLACTKGHKRMVSLLLEARADINHQEARASVSWVLRRHKTRSHVSMDAPLTSSVTFLLPGPHSAHSEHVTPGNHGAAAHRSVTRYQSRQPQGKCFVLFETCGPVCPVFVGRHGAPSRLLVRPHGLGQAPTRLQR